MGKEFMLASRTIKLYVPIDWVDDNYNSRIVAIFEEAIADVEVLVRHRLDRFYEDEYNTGTRSNRGGMLNG